MPSAFSHDARDGIAATTLDALRQADRFALGFVDDDTAVLGYWTSGPGPAAASQERFGSVVLHGRTTSGGLPPHRLLPRHWRLFWRHVAPGDVLRAVVAASAATLTIAPPRGWPQNQPFRVFRPDPHRPPSPPAGADAA